MRLRQEAESDASPATASKMRMRLGSVLEEDIIDEVVVPAGWYWASAQMPVSYYSESFDATLQGHIDGIAYTDGGKEMLGEVKTTSDKLFNEVLVAIHNPETFVSEQFNRYRKQMRRYAAMIFMEHLERGEATEFLPTFGILVMFNRNTCETAIERIPLFAEDEDLQAFLEEQVREEFGGVHPNDYEDVSEVPTPDWASPNHPICSDCYLKEMCWGSRGRSSSETPYPSGEKIGLAYVEGERLTKLGEAMKKEAKASAVNWMEGEESDRLTLSEEISVSRFRVAGKSKLDTQRMKSDGIYDDYLVEGRPYEVVRFNVRK